MEDQRHSRRLPVALGARCRTEHAGRNFVALVDLTAEGCCIFTPTPFLTPGQGISVHPEALSPMSATVRWSRGYLAGLQFDRPLYGPVYEHLASTFARPDDVSLQDALKAEEGDPITLSPALYRALSRKIAAAEKAHEGQEGESFNPYTKRPGHGSRPGLGSQNIDPKRLKLYLE